MKKRTEQILLLRLMPQRSIKLTCQVFNIIRYKIRQLAVLAVIPDLLNRIQLRSIVWQPFNINTAKSSLQSFNAAAADHPAVNHKDYTFVKMHKQFSNKIFKLISTNIGILNIKIQTEPTFSRRDTYRRYYRQSVTSVPAIMKRCLTSGGPCSPDSRLQHKAAFIDKYDGFSRPSGFFLYEANPSCARQRWSAHHALGPVFRVFGNSSPCLSEYARRLKERMQCRSIFRLLRQPVAESKAQCSNHFCGRLSKAVFPASSFAFGSAPVVVPADCVQQKTFRLVFRRLLAIGLWLRALRQRVLQSHSLDGLSAAKQWLFAACFPIAGLFLWVSYPYYRHNTVRLFNFSKSNRTSDSEISVARSSKGVEIFNS